MKLLNEYTNEEKIEWFDKMYNEACKQLKYIEEHEYEHKECEYYMWKTIMD